jgi:thioredoxin-related protein
MKSIMFSIAFLGLISFAQAQNPKLYNPDADAKQELSVALAKAKSENKHVLVQVGGNWCSWCIKFHNFIDTHSALHDSIDKNYVFLLVNYDREHQQEELMKEWKYPNKLGFPVLLILDASGKRLHTQETGSLEKEGSYDEAKVAAFVEEWKRKESKKKRQK